MRAKAQIVADANSPSGYKRQETSPFSQYGITCGLVSILDIKYDGATQSQIDAQKQANLAVITSKTKSLEAIQRTVQITEEGRAAAERAEWDYKTAVGVAQALAESKVSWVPSVMFGGGSSSNSAMDAVGLKMLLDITKSLEKTSK